jgi:uncharacterized protein
MTPILVVPGWTGSGPDHWQTRLEAAHPHARRVHQRDWNAPDRDAWVRTLAREIAAQHAPPVLVAHSLGTLLVAHWAAAHATPVRGALLVAPPDVERAGAPAALGGFAPVPRHPLPFPTIMVSSDDDPYADAAWSRALAADWGSRHQSAGRAGHLNTDAGYGPWPQGERLLAELVEKDAPAVN